MDAPAARSHLARSLDRSLLLVAGLGLLLAGIELALLPLDSPLAPILVLFPLVFLLYLGGGLRAWRRRPGNQMGALIIWGGGAVLLGGLSNTSVPALVIVGELGATLILAVTVHLLHAFPTGRLRGRLSQITVLAAYANSLLLQAPSYLFDAAAGAPGLLIRQHDTVVAVAEWLQRWAGTAVMVATAVVLVARLVHADRARRRVLAPLFAYGAFAVAFVPLGTQVLRPWFGVPPEALAGLQLLVLGGIPLAFGHGILRGGFAKTGELESLGTWLGTAAAGRSDLAQALARTLGDPSLTLSFWVPKQGVFVTEDGALVPPLPEPHRGQADIVLGGRIVGAIGYDRALIEDPALVQAAGQVVAIAVDRERLTAELRESNSELKRSRERLVNAADNERHRIARDLHDGLQMQLVLLALEAQQLAKAPGAPPETAARATRLRQGIDAAAAELRQRVHSVMPAALIERGIAAAAEDLTDRMPVPTTLELTMADGSCPPTVERTAYFVLAEALTNALKHAQAQRIRVRLTVDTGSLHLDVHDDGVGGAQPHGGTGLRGMADRVDVLGGSFAVASAPGAGTRITVVLPCG